MEKVAIMQPYIFPYIGYFQLVNAVDHFVFYDDVNFIKRGWINRNKILINNTDKLITFPCLKVSQNKHINEIEINLEDKTYKNIVTTLHAAYNKAPFFEEVFPLIESLFNSESQNIAEFTTQSIIEVSLFLGLNTKFYKSSEFSPETNGLDKADRLIEITKKLKSQHYINAIGGMSLYEKEYFKNKNVKLDFLEPVIEKYTQFESDFIPSLSIIDVLMFNSKEEIIVMLNEYELI